jgi:hypothetical protein
MFARNLTAREAYRLWIMRELVKQATFIIGSTMADIFVSSRKAVL